MAHYNYLHHRVRRRRAGIDRKRVRIQHRRKEEKSYHQRLNRGDEPERTQLTTPKENRRSFHSTGTKAWILIPTSWHLRKGVTNAKSQQ